ncbi:MORN repeat-containing protein 3-like isoform X6 [Amphibalanus amphitrite]|uniref:MORN repeat-containing protein 3-like isoform X6 n=1 Tax=Amphibalanus amphitrite TaxID=1232801 RepID=UPI001C91FB18|nr:MORN repeat-containing protein 3-like isoform X6 [Amphibalanus amphitrite]
MVVRCETVPTGKGIFEWSNGAIYSGDWAWNRRHGYGVYTELCPRTCQLIQYNGQWCCDKRQGHGVQFYADGESYEGDWHNNKRRGWGRMFYKDGSLYEGEWHDDIREGRGLLRKADGNLYEGTWHRDTKHGPGLYQHKRTGQMQEGIWVDGMVKCSAVEDKNRLFASEPTPYPIPLLELLQPVAVLREAAAEFVPLIPEQYRQAAEAASSASSTYSSTSNVASEPGTDSSSDAASSDTSLLQRCQHRHSLERCARDLRDNSE